MTADRPKTRLSAATPSPNGQHEPVRYDLNIMTVYMYVTPEGDGLESLRRVLLSYYVVATKPESSFDCPY